jgi:two-component system response regulator GlrR
MAEHTESDRGDASRRGPNDGPLIGSSPAVHALAHQISVAAADRYPVWIYGEDGAEHEVTGRLIHGTSPWATGSFCVLDVSVLPLTLQRREVFGAEGGGIPGLAAPHEGVLARARQGSLLLEGIDSISKELQEELARALTSGRFRPLGAQSEVPVECRVLAAGPKALEPLLREGRIVRALADRLNTLEIRIPPLRERREDVPFIAVQALSRAREEIERETGRPCNLRSFSTAAQQRLLGYDWPGNERELTEQIRAAVTLARGDAIQAEDLLLDWASPERVPSFREAKRGFEHEYVTRLLRICRGNISQAARLAKKDRKDFYDVMRRNSINPADFRR